MVLQQLGWGEGFLRSPPCLTLLQCDGEEGYDDACLCLASLWGTRSSRGPANTSPASLSACSPPCSAQLAPGHLTLLLHPCRLAALPGMGS